MMMEVILPTPPCYPGFPIVNIGRQMEIDSGNISASSGNIISFDTEEDRLISQLGLIAQLDKEHSMENIPMVSGGVQQYLNRIRDKVKNKQIYQSQESDVITEGSEDCGCSLNSEFHALPVYVKLHIFSFLGAKDLCRLSRVNREWCCLTSDNILWKTRLDTDMVTWGVIGHMTNPAMYQEVESDLNTKEIYLQCCPTVRHMMRQENFAFLNLSTMLRLLLPWKPPKIAMFGPGLESSTSGIVRRIMYEKNQLFDIKQMFPGQFEGVGSGMTLQMKTGSTFDLTVLYSASKTEREKNRSGNRMQHNHLVQRNVHQMEEGEVDTAGYELTQAVRDLCRTLHAFIYVVDASTDSDSTLDNSELMAMVNERWSATHVPVLVLSCVKDQSCKRLPCVQVAERLQLHKLDKPWQVYDCVVDSLTGVTDSIHWLIQQSQRR